MRLATLLTVYENSYNSNHCFIVDLIVLQILSTVFIYFKFLWMSLVWGLTSSYARSIDPNNSCSVKSEISNMKNNPPKHNNSLLSPCVWRKDTWQVSVYSLWNWIIDWIGLVGIFADTVLRHFYHYSTGALMSVPRDWTRPVHYTDTDESGVMLSPSPER